MAEERFLRMILSGLGLIAIFLLPLPAAGEECTVCHRVAVSGAHARLVCADCHAPGESASAGGCVRCHSGTAGVLHGAMATRARERAFATEAFGKVDGRFFEKNCGSCHVSSCLDCHGGDGHAIARPRPEDCHACHRGYFVGADYRGLAPREDSLRYQRGTEFGGERYLKMRPDVHAEAGLGCGDCHTMASLATGAPAAKGCRDCHVPDRNIIEHGITTHMEKMECWACHSAWGAQEYGTFFLRVGENPVGDYFRVRRETGSEYVRSAYLKRQDTPPLGRNERGLVSPIRPQFIAYYSDLRGSRYVENVPAARQWKAFFPHTVRRGTVLCRECHENPRRFLLEPEGARIYRPDQDGMGVGSFWDRTGQTLANGTFLAPEEVERLAESLSYRRGSVEKWKKLVERVGASSRP